MIAAFQLAACINVPDGLGPGPPCEIAPDGALMLRGSTGQDMLDCITALKLDGVSRVIVDSEGGRVTTAMTIAERLAPLKPEIVIHGQCNSSCANYFLPIARRITLLPGSLILLHGSIDAATAARSQDDIGFQQQAEFTVRHSIHRGWLLYRTPEDLANEKLGKHITGQFLTWNSNAPVTLKFILVEERFIRSCLPNVEITPWENTTAQRIYFDDRMQRSFTFQGIFPSGSMACGPIP